MKADLFTHHTLPKAVILGESKSLSTSDIFQPSQKAVILSEAPSRSIAQDDGLGGK
jgi:hypothetical protein